jgi:hypothetical protein
LIDETAVLQTNAVYTLLFAKSRVPKREQTEAVVMYSLSGGHDGGTENNSWSLIWLLQNHTQPWKKICSLLMLEFSTIDLPVLAGH